MEARIDTTDAIEKNDAINLICMYYARLSSDDLFYKTTFSTNIEKVALFFEIKATTLRNYKDYYDALYDNGRKGWWQKDPKSYPKLYTTYEKYRDIPLDEHRRIVDDILAK